MKDIAIQVENLSKAYQLGQIGTGTISRDLERFVVTKILRKEDPFLKIGQTNDRTVKGSSDIVWSLKDINFDIQKGDAVGIIGKNGAGKSTLLKLLSRVTSPTTGSMKVKGRIASLLEVGTGFHPELTGKENIFLNGAILGMRKHEIKRKFDEIVAFSGVERYIDTPVKRYSSGMYVRLAFAVAAHLESEILIVDEVLAVGDAEFQKKCLGKMGDISKGEGRTVLFVSHNMAAVQNLCSKGLILENGKLNFWGNVNDCINKYISSSNNKVSLSLNERKDRKGISNIMLRDVKISNEIKTGTRFQVELTYESKVENLEIKEFGISIWDAKENRIISISSTFKNQLNQLNLNGKVSCEIPSLPLVKGRYFLNAFVSSVFGIEDYIENITDFEVEENDVFGFGKIVDPLWGMIVVEHNWEKIV